MIKLNEINLETRLEIIKQYLNNISSKQIARNLNIGYGTVFETLNYHKIPKRNPNDLSKAPMKENYFDNIDSEEKAYFLGWMYADGNVSKNLKTASLTVHKNDKNIIKKLNDLIYFKGNHFSIYKNTCILNLCRKSIVSSLINCGCIPNKTFNLKFPSTDIVPLNLQQHFIRGYFDGDGSIGYYGENKTFFANIVAFESFYPPIIELLQKYNPLISYKIESINNKGTKIIRFCGINPIRLADFLYKNSTIYLNRKFNKFLEMTKFQLTKKYTNNNGEWIKNKSRDVIEISKYFQTTLQKETEANIEPQNPPHQLSY